MSNTSCDYLTNVTFPTLPYFTYSAIAWRAPENKTASNTIQKCCGGPAWPLQSYENDCLVWCETSDYWSQVLACSQEHDFQGHSFIGNTKGSYIFDPQHASIMFPDEPEPPFLAAELEPPYTTCRQTRVLKTDYCVSEEDADEESAEEKALWLDDVVENLRLSQLRAECDVEVRRKQRLMDEARGWIFNDKVKIQEARGMKMKSCRLLKEMENRMGRSSMLHKGSNWIGLIILCVICTKIFKLW